MQQFYSLSIFMLFIFTCCNRHKEELNRFYEIQPSPYTFPIWHPNGQILGFNHTPVSSPDSTGFWLIKADGTGKRRVLNIKIFTPAWSPDGKWLAYSDGANLFKVYFDGFDFDLTQIKLLTNSGRNYFPSWNSTGDSIVYDSNAETINGGYRLWKISSDGKGKSMLAPGITPLWKDGSIYFVGRDSTGPGIMEMNTEGLKVKKVVNQQNTTQNLGVLRFWDNYLFYQFGGIYKGQVAINNFSEIPTGQIADNGFDISPQGIIAFVLYNGKVDLMQGTIWTMKSDGSDKKQLTFNKF